MASLFDLRTLLTGLLIFAVVSAGVYVFKLLQNPLLKLPGPRIPRSLSGLALGNLPEVFAAGTGELHRKWASEHGPVLAYTAGFLAPRLMLTDPAALHHILTNAYDFPKPQQVRGDLARILGKGVLFAEGEDHRRQRKLLNPAFGGAQVARLTPVFFEQAYRLRDKWISDILGDEKEQTIEVSGWMGRVTLDIIGQAAFAYDFGGLDNTDNKLAGTFRQMMNLSGKRRWYTLFFFVLLRIFPSIANLPTERAKKIRQMFGVMEEESQRIIDGRREALANAAADDQGRDLLALLLKANDTAAGKASMTDDEIKGQMTTFILAGHETTSTALTWVLHFLTRNKDVQDKLRAELRKARIHSTAATPGEGPSLNLDALNALPYLDAVTREILRLRPPVPNTIRESSHDAVVPLAAPLKDGSSQLFVPAGTTLFLSIINANCSNELWGDDADDFRPERWSGGQDGLPKRAREEVSQYALWGTQLTFLGGPRACVGYRFALAEFKAILAVLVTTFEFEETIKAEDFETRSAIVSRPFLRGRTEEGSQMPLKVKLAA